MTMEISNALLSLSCLAASPLACPFLVDWYHFCGNEPLWLLAIPLKGEFFVSSEPSPSPRSRPLLGEHYYRLFGGNELRFGRLITPPLAWVGRPSRSSYNDNRTCPESIYYAILAVGLCPALWAFWSSARRKGCNTQRAAFLLRHC
jgi:hypothetical protein